MADMEKMRCIGSASNQVTIFNIYLYSYYLNTQHPFILPARALITRIKMFQWHSTMSTKWDFWVEEVCNISNCVVIALLLATVYQADIANSRLEGSNIIERRRNEIMTRNHNLDVFYKPMTCDDLVVDVKECEIAIGWYYVA